MYNLFLIYSLFIITFLVTFFSILCDQPPYSNLNMAPTVQIREIKMDKRGIIDIAEGLKLIEEGVEKIQGAMRESNIKSIKDIAEQLIPIFKEDDDSLSESIIKHME